MPHKKDIPNWESYADAKSRIESELLKESDRKKKPGPKKSSKKSAKKTTAKKSTPIPRSFVWMVSALAASGEWL